MDEKPADRSIQDEGESSEGQTSRPAEDTQGEGTTDGASVEKGSDQNATAGEESQYSEADYFENPYAVLAEIARETGQQANVSDAGDGGAQTSGPASGASGGEAYRDPFDPDFWSQQAVNVPNVDPVTEEPAMLSPEALASDAEVVEEALSQVANEPQPAPAPAAEPAEAASPSDAGPAEMAALSDESAGTPAGGVPEGTVEPEVADPESMEAAPVEDRTEDAESLREAIETEIAGVSGRLAEGLEVTPSEGGLLISLTDQLDYGMFNIGSSIPQRDLVLAMERIGALLAEREGSIVIRGHTDARPFRGGENDNWRLSTDRAHSAYYMLVRGGLSEERVVQVSGFADRRPKLPDDPFAAANRRIEILVQADESEMAQ
jgi:chemotaxis protein MotB